MLTPIFALGLANPLSFGAGLVATAILLSGSTWGYFIHSNVRWREGGPTPFSSRKSRGYGGQYCCGNGLASQSHDPIVYGVADIVELLRGRIVEGERIGMAVAQATNFLGERRRMGCQSAP